MNKSVAERYGVKEFPGSSHTWAKGHLRGINQSSSVLDFGAGTGLIGQYLYNSGVKNLAAVDHDAEALAAIRNFYQQTARTLGEIEKDDFDWLILLDILEHLTDPADTLRDVTAKLRPGGNILLSLPNIAHWSIRLSLLFGFFEYTDRGLIDRTHYNHFNRRRVFSLVNSQSNLRIKEFRVSTSPAQLALPPAIWQNKVFESCDPVRLKLANLLPGLLGYQHLLLLEKQ